MHCLYDALSMWKRGWHARQFGEAESPRIPSQQQWIADPTPRDLLFLHSYHGLPALRFNQRFFWRGTSSVYLLSRLMDTNAGQRTAPDQGRTH